jgi:hypothetical protein
MNALAAPAASPPGARVGSTARRIAFLGPRAWVEACAPSVATHSLDPRDFPVDGGSLSTDELRELDGFGPQITVVFDPPALGAESLAALPGVRLGVLVGDTPAAEAAPAVRALDRVVSFRPALTGTAIPGGRVWRAIPTPVSDGLFGEVRQLHGRPRVMAIGRSTEHREWALMPAKHHHDLLQVIYGVTGTALIELLRDYDVGVYVSPGSGGGFGAQVGIHLAAGHLLLAGTLAPLHGLERNLDYLHFDSPQELVWVLDRLGRFPEMHQRIRFRGRLKAEHYRASRLFARIAFDLLADVAAFGSDRSG